MLVMRCWLCWVYVCWFLWSVCVSLVFWWCCFVVWLFCIVFDRCELEEVLVWLVVDWVLIVLYGGMCYWGCYCGIGCWFMWWFSYGLRYCSWNVLFLIGIVGGWLVLVWFVFVGWMFVCGWGELCLFRIDCLLLYRYWFFVCKWDFLEVVCVLRIWLWLVDRWFGMCWCFVVLVLFLVGCIVLLGLFGLLLLVIGWFFWYFGSGLWGCWLMVVFWVVGWVCGMWVCIDGLLLGD